MPIISYENPVSYTTFLADEKKFGERAFLSDKLVIFLLSHENTLEYVAKYLLSPDEKPQIAKELEKTLTSRGEINARKLVESFLSRGENLVKLSRGENKFGIGSLVPITGIYRCIHCWHESVMCAGEHIQPEHEKHPCCPKTERELIVFIEENNGNEEPDKQELICLSLKGYCLTRSDDVDDVKHVFDNFSTDENCNSAFYSNAPYTGVYEHSNDEYPLYIYHQGDALLKGEWRLILATNAAMNKKLNPEFKTPPYPALKQPE